MVLEDILEITGYSVLGYDEEDGNDEPYTLSSTEGDYSPSNPWDAPGMSISDFI